MRKFLLRFGLALFVTVLFALAIEGGVNLWQKWQFVGLPPAVREVSHCEYDPDLGWRHVANKTVPNLYGPGIGLSTNSQHMRGPGNHEFEDNAGKYRILCLGDSFTMGYGVADDETYPALLAQQHGELETINMGLGGYGFDQCYLWYERDGTRFSVDVLLCALILGDFFRMNPEGNVADIPKPVLDLRDGNPIVLNTPVANILATPPFGTRLLRLWQQSAVASLLPRTLAAPTAGPVPVQKQRFAPIAMRLFEILRDQSQKRGQLFVVALLPVLEEIAPPKHEIIDDWLKPGLVERGIHFLDLRPAFRKVPTSELEGHFTQGHYSKRGNLVAAQAMLEYLRELDPKCPR